MAINKKTREAVYRKYGGRCAYCGRAIAYKDMQVDHFRPLRVWDEVDGAADERDKAAQIFTWCMVVAMHQEEGIGATRLERACNEMHEFQQRYRTKS